MGNKTFYTNFQTKKKKKECIAFEDSDVKYLERDVYAFESWRCEGRVPIK